MLHTSRVFTIVHATNFNHDFMIMLMFWVSQFFVWMVVCQNCHWKCTKFCPEPDSREVQEDLQNLHHPKRVKKAYLEGQVLWKYDWFQSARDRVRQTSFHQNYQNTYLSQSHHFPALLLETLKSSHIKRTFIFQCPIFGFHPVDGSEIWLTSWDW